MKRAVALMLSVVLLLTSCSVQQAPQADGSEGSAASETTEEVSETGTSDEGTAESGDDEEPEFSGLDDPDLLPYVEDAVYSDLIDQLDGEYFIENVSATYISEEYLEEVAYNSQANIYFGYTLEELEDEFQGTKYVFALGDDGTTTVEAFEEYDDTYDQVVRNVATGTGVILVCVTVSAVSGGTAPAVSMVFAFAAKTGTVVALQSAYISGIAGGVITGVQTGDFDEATKAAALAASEGFKIGAISGAISGGANEALGLYGATLNGLSLDDAAKIQRESKWPLEVIKCLHSTDEYKYYMSLGLAPTQLDSTTWILARSDIDWNLTDDYGRTNLERAKEGLAALDSTGNSFELHHVGQDADGPLAILTNAEHHSSDIYDILHWADEGKDITDSAWNAQRQEIWKEIASLVESGAL